MNLCCQKVHIFQRKEEKDILPLPTLWEETEKQQWPLEETRLNIKLHQEIQDGYRQEYILALTRQSVFYDYLSTARTWSAQEKIERVRGGLFVHIVGGRLGFRLLF